MTAAENDHYRRLLQQELDRKRRIKAKYDWSSNARPKQQIPDGNWSKVIWIAGRGFGKSRCIMEFARHRAKAEKTRGILVARTAADIRDVLIDGESGIMAISPPDFRPKYEPTKRRLTWPNGSIAVCLSADEPDSLRGPQCLVSGTPVLMGDNSLKTIDSIVSGDYVKTRKGPQKVLKAWMSCHSADVYRLLDSSGRNIVGTNDHPVFVEGKGFVSLGKLSSGDRITTGHVVSVTRLTLRAPVYDIEVEGEHEFFANGILVHNCHWAACDEIAAWKYIASWNNLMFGLRLPSKLGPQVSAATTPKPCPLLAELKADAKKNPDAVIIIGGSTYENRENLDPKFFADITTRYEGTRLGRQELDGELLEDVPGALWTQARIDQLRVAPGEEPEMQRIVVAIDPSTTSGEESNECGIVACGKGVDGHDYTLADRSGIMTPFEWASVAISLFHELHADAVIGEANNGGDLIETTLRFIDPTIPYRKVTASRGKMARAEPISALAEQGRSHQIGRFDELEKQMCMMTGEGYTGAGSPDRCDAKVWATSELMGGSGNVQMFPDFRARQRGPSEPKHAVHVATDLKLKDWWPRWISATSGQNSAAHWWAREPEGRVRVYRELIMKDAPAEEFGMAIAEMSSEEIRGSRIVPVWMGDTAFDLVAGKSTARSLYSGIEKAVGAHKSFLFVHDERERSMEDNAHRIQSVQNRLSAMPKGTLSVQSIKSASAAVNNQSGWDVVREMLRWRPKDVLTRREAPDWDHAMELAYTDQPAYCEYIRQFSTVTPEVLPQLTFAAECHGLIQAMSGATRLLSDQDKLAESNAWYLLQSLRIGALASREEAGQEPMEEFVGRRLDTLSADAAPMSRHMVAIKAEADWRTRFGNHGPINFSRAASGRKSPRFAPRLH
jgi:phage terminase large subunit-like protein